MTAKEALRETRKFVQECREEGETDLRSILYFIDSKIKECDDNVPVSGAGKEE